MHSIRFQNGLSSTSFGSFAEYEEFCEKALANKKKDIAHRKRNLKCPHPRYFTLLQPFFERAYCSCSATSLLRCSRCKLRGYCSLDHQKLDCLVHKKFCFPPACEIPTLNKDLLTKDPAALEDRQKDARYLVNDFFNALDEDGYPTSDSTCEVFGATFHLNPPKTFGYVGRIAPVGTVVYNAWSFIKKNSEYDLRSEIVDALLAGLLPSYFKHKVMIHGTGKCCYCDELIMREFKGIEWDQRAHLRLAGKKH